MNIIIYKEFKGKLALKLTKIEDVWGIERQYSKKLQYYNVNTALDFTQRSKAWVATNGRCRRKNMA